LALGTAIVNELRLDTRGELLQRWMAHHLAEQIAKADGASGAAKAKHERAAVNLILKLWVHRRALPEQADPLAAYRDAVDVLKMLLPAANPWRRHGQDRPYVGLLQEMFDAMARSLVGGIALTQVRQLPNKPKDVRCEFLDPSEQGLAEAFDRWLPLLDRTQRPKVVILQSASTPEPIDGADDGKAAPSTQDMARQAKGDSELHAAVAENLARVHADLGRLMERWKATQDGKEDELEP
jgi:hypothetical protein